jgi:membrane protease YdiL (CAAX protease family)
MERRNYEESGLMNIEDLAKKLPVIVRALLSGFVVIVVGIYGSLLLLSVTPLPFTPFVVVGFLALFCYYLAGNGPPKSTKKMRKNAFRMIRLAKGTWITGLILSVLFVVVGQSFFVLTFRVFEYPTAEFTQGLNLDELSLPIAWMAIILSSLTAGVAEEVGFRGYFQVPLEEKYGLRIANTIVSVVFVLFHLNQAWAVSILLHLFVLSYLMGLIAQRTGSLLPGIIGHTLIDIINFSYWWSDVAGSFEMELISTTGIDTHFVFWAIVFVASLMLFYLVNRRKNHE